jgi:hypothetical protein
VRKISQEEQEGVIMKNVPQRHGELFGAIALIKRGKSKSVKV